MEGTCYYFYDLGLYGAYIFIIYLRVTGYSNGVVVSPYTPCCHNVGYTYPSPPSLACHAKLHIHFPEEVAHTPSAFNIANISGSTTSHRFVQLSTTTTCHPYDYTTVKQILKSTMSPSRCSRSGSHIVASRAHHLAHQKFSASEDEVFVPDEWPSCGKATHPATQNPAPC